MADELDRISANSHMIGGSHYHKHGTSFQHWDMVALFNLDYFQGQITKYVLRWKEKNGIQDLEKARHYLDKYIEVEKAGLERRRQNATERVPTTSSPNGMRPGQSS